MPEKIKNVVLKDEELDKVTGGSSGTIPESGIVYSNYVSLSDGCFYAHGQNTNDVVFVFNNNGNYYYVKQIFMFEGSNWWATDKNNGRLIENISGFMSYYPYLLNIKP